MEPPLPNRNKFLKMRKYIYAILILSLLLGCRDKLDDPVGLDEVPKDIPAPVFIDGIRPDSISNYHFSSFSGSSQLLWIGKADSFETRILARFSIDDTLVLANADSGKVTVALYGSLGRTVEFEVHPLNRTWDESKVDWDQASSDSNWSLSGGDYDTSTIATLVINEEEVDFTFRFSDFPLIDTSHTINRGMIFIYTLGDTNVTLYSSESAYKPLRITVFYGDSSKIYSSSDHVTDAYIVNSTYVSQPNEVVIGEGYAMRALFMFNLDMIPDNVTINKAYVTYSFKGNKSYLDSMEMYIHRITSEWDEENTEYNSTPSAEFIVHKDDSTVEVPITGLVQHWLNENDNKGILLRARNESSIISRLILDVQEMPQLSIYYTPAPEREGK
jgi:hypothetical protein